MPRKKERAGSAKTGIAKNLNDSSGSRDDSADNMVAGIIENLEVALAAVDFAVAPFDETDFTPTDMLTPDPSAVPIVQCHASISYVRGHRALSLNLFWDRTLAASSDSGEAVQWLLLQSGPTKIHLFGPSM
jgi:hypothetical protein